VPLCANVYGSAAFSVLSFKEQFFRSKCMPILVATHSWTNYRPYSSPANPLSRTAVSTISDFAVSTISDFQLVTNVNWRFLLAVTQH
jgi:hypothetical protein